MKPKTSTKPTGQIVEILFIGIAVLLNGAALIYLAYYFFH